MPDTIELLEAIGRDASLRHASPEALAHALADVDAPGALTTAVSLGTTSSLEDALGHARMHTLHGTQTPGHDDHDHDHDHDHPGHDDDGDKPDRPHEPHHPHPPEKH